MEKNPALIRCTEDKLIAFILDFSLSPVIFPKLLCFCGCLFMKLRSLNDLEDTWIISSSTVSSIPNSV